MHRPTHPSAGAPEASTGPTADPDAHAALPRALIARGREWRGNVWPLGVLTGALLGVAAVLGLYTLALVYRHPPRMR
jgi:hypothetical protein